MQKRLSGGLKKMDISFIIMAILVLILGTVTFTNHGISGLNEGLKETFHLLKRITPQIILGLTAAGLIQVVIPSHLIARWIGEGSGITGILIATGAGALTPAGPFVSFPIVASLYKGGAGIGPLTAYVIAWGILPIHRVLIWELPLMGPSFTSTRYLASIVLPIIGGLIAPSLYAIINKYISDT